MCRCLCLCMSMCRRLQRQEASNLLELVLGVSHLMGVLSTELKPYGRAAHTLNHGAVSPAPLLLIVTKLKSALKLSCLATSLFSVPFLAAVVSQLDGWSGLTGASLPESLRPHSNPVLRGIDSCQWLLIVWRLGPVYITALVCTWPGPCHLPPFSFSPFLWAPSLCPSGSRSS